MPGNTIEQLLTLQKKDQLIRQLAIDAAEIPRRKKKLSSTLDAQRVAVETTTDAYQRLQVDIKDIEGDVELSKEKINRYSKQQMDVKDNESYRALDNEIRGLKRHILRQEDRQLELMGQVEIAESSMNEQKEELDRQIKEVASEEAVLDVKEAKLTEEIQSHQTEAEALRAGVDEEWLDRYDRTFKHTGDVALVPSNGGKCGGCNMQIPPALVLASKTDENISTCNYCGRMLYFDLY